MVALVNHSWWALLGIALLINGLSGRCGGYALLGFSTASSCDLPPSDTAEKQTGKR
jgi:hypothetical protein